MWGRGQHQERGALGCCPHCLSSSGDTSAPLWGHWPRVGTAGGCGAVQSPVEQRWGQCRGAQLRLCFFPSAAGAREDLPDEITPPEERQERSQNNCAARWHRGCSEGRRIPWLRPRTVSGGDTGCTRPGGTLSWRAKDFCSHRELFSLKAAGILGCDAAVMRGFAFSPPRTQGQVCGVPSTRSTGGFLREIRAVLRASLGAAWAPRPLSLFPFCLLTLWPVPTPSPSRCLPPPHSIPGSAR